MRKLWESRSASENRSRRCSLTMSTKYGAVLPSSPAPTMRKGIFLASCACCWVIAESMDGKTSAIPKINFVGVKLENLRLGETMFELEGHHGLSDFAAQGSVTVEEETARHLHGNCAATLDARAMAQISPGGSKNAHRIEAGMLKETPVLHRQDGITQHFRNIIEVHCPALLARSAKQAAQQLRLDFGGVKRRA